MLPQDQVRPAGPPLSAVFVVLSLPPRPTAHRRLLPADPLPCPTNPALCFAGGSSLGAATTSTNPSPTVVDGNTLKISVAQAMQSEEQLGFIMEQVGEHLGLTASEVGALKHALVFIGIPDNAAGSGAYPVVDELSRAGYLEQHRNGYVFQDMGARAEGTATLGARAARGARQEHPHAKALVEWVHGFIGEVLNATSTHGFWSRLCIGADDATAQTPARQMRPHTDSETWFENGADYRLVVRQSLVTGAETSGALLLARTATLTPNTKVVVLDLPPVCAYVMRSDLATGRIGKIHHGVFGGASSFSTMADVQLKQRPQDDQLPTLPFPASPPPLPSVLTTTQQPVTSADLHRVVRLAKPLDAWTNARDAGGSSWGVRGWS